MNTKLTDTHSDCSTVRQVQILQIPAFSGGVEGVDGDHATTA